MFFRIKKIKGKGYAYIVENLWNRKGSRQKVKGYIGRVYRFELKNNVGFSEYINKNIQDYIENNSKNKVISDLVEWELFKFGIDKNEFAVDLTNITLQKNGKNVAFLLNEGFMCSRTLKNLFEFKTEGDEEADGYRFARCFVEAGIKVPQDVFIGLFQKLLSF